MPMCSKCGKPITAAVMLCDECMPRWIPVSERFPRYDEVGDKVLVVLNGTDRLGREYRDAVECVGYDDDGWFCVYRGESFVCLNGIVTHWMPLPAPPDERRR